MISRALQTISRAVGTFFRGIGDSVLRLFGLRPSPSPSQQAPPVRAIPRRRQRARAAQTGEPVPVPPVQPQKPESPMPYDLAAQPLPPQPLCIPLPEQWKDDPFYFLNPYSIAGTAFATPQFGNIGLALHNGSLVAFNFNDPFAHAYIGPPDSGKSYMEGVIIETALQPDPYQNVLPAPLCAIALAHSRHAGESHGMKLLHSRFPNRNVDEVRRLILRHGSLPKGIEDIVCITLNDKAPRIHQAHPHCRVVGLKAPCRELGIEGLLSLMIMSDKEDTLLCEEVKDMLGTLPKNFNKKDLKRAVLTYNFRNDHLRDTVRRRVRLACRYIDDRVSLRSLIKAGRLIVVDIQDGWLSEETAMKLFRIVVDILILGESELPCGLLLVIDEAHHFLAHKQNRLQIERIIKERRHLKTSVLLSSQDPTKIPHSTLAELDGVGLFGTSSEKSIKHLAGDIGPFSILKAELCGTLLQGQMIFWSRRWYTPNQPGEYDGVLLRVEGRPRLSQHGGETRRAVPR